MIRDPKPSKSNIVAIQPAKIISTNANRCIPHGDELSALASKLVQLPALLVLEFATKSSRDFTEPVDTWGSGGCVADVAGLGRDVLQGDPVRNGNGCEEFRGWVVDDCEGGEFFWGGSKGLRFGLVFVFDRVGKSEQCKGQEGKEEDGDL